MKQMDEAKDNKDQAETQAPWWSSITTVTIIKVENPCIKPKNKTTKITALNPSKITSLKHFFRLQVQGKRPRRRLGCAAVKFLK